MTDDCVEYRLYPIVTSKDLAQYIDDFYVHLSPYLLEYLWENEGFRLRVKDGDDDGKFPPHLYGHTKLGENIEDEWFIVFLLTELTKNFPDLVARVTDNDGEFLLIEMAEYLPDWLDPDTAENRVYIYQGNVHIIPQEGQFLKKQPEIGEAIQFIRDSPKLTKCEIQLQMPILSRIERYPMKIKEDQHVAHCYLPAALVALLKKDPTLVAPAVRVFYSRDALDIRICRKMEHFPPKDRVMTAVRFTKCLYAQLVQQTYVPDKLVGWNIPVVKNPNFKSYDIGMKLACGFEILVSNCDSDVPPASSDFNLDIRWQQYVKALQSKGYFRGELEGSKLYKELLEKAQQYYCTHVLEASGDTSEIGQRILSLLDSIDVDVEKLREEENSIQPPDDDSWLDMTPEKFDSYLEERFNQMFTRQLPKDVSTNIIGGLKNFIHHPSGIDGVEFPPRNAKRSTKGINFNPEEFANAMQSTLGIGRKRSEGSDREASDDNDSDDDFFTTKGDEKSEAQKMLNEMEAYMDQMDRELAKTKVGESFERLPHQKTNNVSEKGDDYTPVDQDLTALRNILESFNSQQGLPGPASNIMHSMGIPIPQDAEEVD